MPTHQAKPHFIPPMPLQRVPSLPENADRVYEVKLESYQALAIKTDGKFCWSRKQVTGSE